MKPISRKQLATFASACHRAAKEHRLMQCSSGNMSWRADDERMLVSGTRTWLGEIRTDQIAVVRIADGGRLNSVKPSVEAGFHAGVLRARPDVSVVLHFQTPFATALACRRDLERVNFFVIPEIPYYIGRIALVPFLPPGSEALARAVVAAMASHDMAILRNHGLVTVGGTFDDAFQKAVFFELASSVIVRAGDHVECLPRKDVEMLLHKPGKV